MEGAWHIKGPYNYTHTHTHTHIAASRSHTSLNSGLSVFFFTAVLCFDFLFSSGFRYLQESRAETQYLEAFTAEKKKEKKTTKPSRWAHRTPSPCVISKSLMWKHRVHPACRGRCGAAQHPTTQHLHMTYPTLIDSCVFILKRKEMNECHHVCNKCLHDEITAPVEFNNLYSVQCFFWNAMVKYANEPLPD